MKGTIVGIESYIQKYRKSLISVLLALLLTVMQISGWQFSMKYGTSVHHSEFFEKIGMLKPYQCVILGIAEWIVLSIFIYWGFGRLSARKSKRCPPLLTEPKHLWLYVTTGLYLVYILCLLGCYPGFYCYDMGNQLPQIMYPEVPFNAHHSLLHTILGGGVITLGYRICSVDLTFGVFLYNLVQMGICAVSFGYAARFVYRVSRNRILTVLSCLFYAFCPPVVMFAMTTTKDVACYAVLLAACITQYEIYKKLSDDETEGVITKRQWISSGLLLCLACLLRKNIVYAIVAFMICSFILYKKYRKKLLLFFLCVLSAYAITGNGMIAALDAKKSSAAEALSVPFQQIARLYAQEGEDAFVGEDLELLYDAIDQEMLSLYNPMIADPIKTAFWYHLDTIMNNKWEYISLWCRKGLEYPLVYIVSFAENTYQTWYPWTELMDLHEYRYFIVTDWIVEYCRPKCRPLYDFYMGISQGSYRSYPFIRLLFSTGTMFWASLISLFYTLWDKNKPAAAILFLELLVCASAMCGPVSDLRYHLILFYMFPVALGFMLKADPRTDE